MDNNLAIKDIATIKHGFAFEGQYFSSEKQEYALLTPGNFHIDQKLYFGSNTKYYKGPIPEGYVLSDGDLLVVMTDLTKNMAILGNAVLLQSALPVLHNQRIGLVEVSTEVSKEYLCYLLNSEGVRRHVKATASGTTVRHTSPSKILDVKAFFPPLPDQRKIATILGTWDKAISTTERLIDNSKQQKKALMQQLLTGKKRLPDDSGKPFVGNFKRLNLRDLTSIDKRSLGKKTPSNFEFSYISLSDVETGKIAKKLVRHNYASSPSRARRVVHDGDILLATVRPNLKGFAKAKKEHDGMIASTGFSVLTPKPDVSGEYLYHYLFSCHITGQINALVVGSNYPAINSSDVSGLKVYAPSYEEQVKIARILTNNDQSLTQLEQQLANLKQEKKALMQQLLTGQRRVTVN